MTNKIGNFDVKAILAGSDRVFRMYNGDDIVYSERIIYAISSHTPRTIWAINVDDPTQSVYLGELPSGVNAVRGITEHNGDLYCLDSGSRELWKLDVNNLSNATLVGNYPSTLQSPYSLTSHNGSLYTANISSGPPNRKGLWEIDLDNPADSTHVGRFPSGVGGRFTTLESHKGVLYCIEDRTYYSQQLRRYIYNVPELWNVSTSDPQNDTTSLGTIPSISGVSWLTVFIVSDGENLYIYNNNGKNIILVDTANLANTAQIGQLSSETIGEPYGITSYNDLLYCIDREGRDELWVLDHENANTNYLVGDLPSTLSSGRALCVHDDNMYGLSSTYLWNIDPSDTENSTQVGRFPQTAITSTSTYAAYINTIAHHDGQTYGINLRTRVGASGVFRPELWNINLENPDRSFQIGQLPNGITGSPRNITLVSHNSILYLIEDRTYYRQRPPGTVFVRGELWQVDVNDPLNGTVSLGELPVGMRLMQAAMSHDGTFYCYAQNDRSLWEIDTSNLDNSSMIGTFHHTALTDPKGLVAINNNLYTMNQSPGHIWRINTTSPESSFAFGATPSGMNNTRVMCEHDDRFLMFRSQRTLVEIDLTDTRDGSTEIGDINYRVNYVGSGASGICLHSGQVYAINYSSLGGNPPVHRNYLWNINVDNPERSFLIGIMPSALNHTLCSLASHNGTLYCLENNGSTAIASLWSIDTGTPSDSTLIGSLPTGFRNPTAMASFNNTLYAFNLTGSQLWEIDTGTPANSTKVGDFPAGITSLYAMGVHNNNLYAARNATPDELWQIDTGTLSDSTKVGEFGASTKILNAPAALESHGSKTYSMQTTSPRSLWEVDLTNPARSVNIPGTFPAALSDVREFASFNNTLYAIDVTGRELWSIDTDTPADSTEIGTFPSALSEPAGMTVHDSKLYVMDGVSGTAELWEVDTSDPSNSTEVGDLTRLSMTQVDALAVHSNVMYGITTASRDRLCVINPTNVQQSYVVGLLPNTLSTARGMTSHDGSLYCFDISGREIWEIDTDDPGNSTLVGAMPTSVQSGRCLFSYNNELYLYDQTGREIWEVDLSDPSNSTVFKTVPSNLGTLDAFTVQGGEVYAVQNTSQDRLWRINMSNLDNSVELGVVDSTTPYDMTSLNNVLYLSDRSSHRLWSFTLPSNTDDPIVSNLIGRFPYILLSSPESIFSYNSNMYCITQETKSRLWYIDPDNPLGNYLVGEFPENLHPRGVTVNNNTVYCLNRNRDSIWVVNTTNPERSYEIPGQLPQKNISLINGLASINNQLVAHDRTDRTLWNINLTDTQKSSLRGQRIAPLAMNTVNAAVSANNVLYGSDTRSPRKLWVLNDTNPIQSYLIGDFPRVMSTGGKTLRDMANHDGATYGVVTRGNAAEEFWQINLSNPERSFKIGDLPQTPSGFTTRLTTIAGLESFNNKLYAIDDSGDGLWEINVTDPESSTYIGDIGASVFSNCYSMGSFNNVPYIINYKDPDELWLLDTDNPSHSYYLSSFPVAAGNGVSAPRSLTVKGTKLYLLDRTRRSIWDVNVVNAENSVNNGVLPHRTVNTPTALASINDTMYLINNTSPRQLWVVNETNPLHSYIVGHFDISLSENLIGLEHYNNKTYTIWHRSQNPEILIEVDLSNPENHVEVGPLPTTLISPTDLATHDGNLYALDLSQDELWQLDVTNPSNSTLVGRLSQISFASANGMAAFRIPIGTDIPWIN